MSFLKNFKRNIANTFSESSRTAEAVRYQNNARDIRKLATKMINDMTDRKKIPVASDQTGTWKINDEAIETLWDKISIVFKQSLNKLSKSILKDLASDIEISMDYPVSNDSEIKNNLKNDIVSFYRQKFELIVFVLNNYEFNCKLEVDAVNKNFNRIMGNESEKNMKESKKRLDNLNISANDYYSELLDQLKLLQKDITRKELNDIDKKVHDIMIKKGGKCCVNLDGMRNFIWMQTADEKTGDKYYYNNWLLNNDGIPVSMYELPKFSDIGGLMKQRKTSDITQCGLEPSSLEKVKSSLENKMKQIKQSKMYKSVTSSQATGYKRQKIE